MILLPYFYRCHDGHPPTDGLDIVKENHEYYGTMFRLKVATISHESVKKKSKRKSKKKDKKSLSLIHI